MYYKRIEQYIAVQGKHHRFPAWILKALNLTVREDYYTVSFEDGIYRFSEIAEFSHQEVDYCEKALDVMLERAETETFEIAVGHFRGSRLSEIEDAPQFGGRWERATEKETKFLPCYWPKKPTGYKDLDGGFVCRFSYYNRIQGLSDALTTGRRLKRNRPLPEGFYEFWDKSDKPLSGQERIWFKENFTAIPQTHTHA